ncbi:autotransporter-associated beta strand repeat-containing protein, partial [Brucella anthropi]|uniref:autotransporter-associated beta strand repeat-containing protein n=1 Tax=Brucella anthropi TaxID=529 RepID=UPI003986AAEA
MMFDNFNRENGQSLPVNLCMHADSALRRAAIGRMTRRRKVSTFLCCVSVLALSLGCGWSPAYADYIQGEKTYPDDQTTCRLNEEYYGGGCFLIERNYGQPYIVTFDKNIAIDVSSITLQSTTHMFGVLAFDGNPGVEVRGDFTVTGLGRSDSQLAVQSAAIGMFSDTLVGFDAQRDFIVVPTYTFEGNISVDGGMLINTSGPNAMINGNPDGDYIAPNVVTVDGTTTMHVAPDARMMYNDGQAAVLPPINLDTVGATFNGAIDFDLPVLTAQDGSGHQSVYGAILLTGDGSRLDFAGGGTYTIHQNYQDAVQGLNYYFSNVSNPYFRRAPEYGWVTAMGMTNILGGINNTGAFGVKPRQAMAEFNATGVNLNYTLQGGVPTTPWGIVSLESNASSTLTNVNMTLNMQGTPTARTSVFYGGMQQYPYLTAEVDSGQTPPDYTDIFTLDGVNVTFDGSSDSGKYVSLFYIDSSNTTVTATNHSSLQAANQDADWSDRSLIYIDRTLPPLRQVIDGNPVYAPGPDTTSLDFHATDSTLAGGAYVAASSMSNTSLAMTLDGTTTWGGTIKVDADGSTYKSNATLTLGDTAHWTGSTISNNGNITLALNDRSVWTATENVLASPFQGGSIALNGGTIQAGKDDFAIGAALSLGMKGGIIDTDGRPSFLSGKVSGTGTFTKSGLGTLTVSGANNYTGGTVFAGGVLSADAESRLGSGGLTFDGGTLQVMGTNWTSTAQTVTLAAGGGVFDIADVMNNFTVSQGVTGTGFLTKSGSGTLTLSGNNSYGGATSVSAGTLVLTGANTGGGTTTIDAGAALHIGTGGTVGSLAGDIVNNGALVVDRAGTITPAGTIPGSGGRT